MTVAWGSLFLVFVVSLAVGVAVVVLVAFALVLIAAAGGIYAASRRNPISAHNVNDVPVREPATAAA